MEFELGRYYKHKENDIFLYVCGVCNTKTWGLEKVVEVADNKGRRLEAASLHDPEAYYDITENHYMREKFEPGK